MKKNQRGTRKETGQKRSAARPAERPKSRRIVTGQTEIMDFDLEEELERNGAKEQDRRPPKSTARPKEPSGSRVKKSKPVEKNREKTVPGKSWEDAAAMPEKPVTLSDETLELLEMDEYLNFVPKKRDRVKERSKRDAADSPRQEDRQFRPDSPRQADRQTRADKLRRTDRANRPARRGGAKPVKKSGVLNDFSMMDKVIAATGVLVIFAALVTIGIFSSANASQKQIAAMAELGEKMETIGIAGEGIFTAVADAQAAGKAVADYVEQEEYEEKDLVTQVAVGLKLTSVQRDMKIKFTNKNSGKLIANQAFEVKIEGPEKLTKADDDKDGIIYIKDIKPGEYTVTITAPEKVENSKAAGVQAIVTVKDKIEYKKVDVTDEVKTESQINAAKEDTAVHDKVESVLKDTVEWVESTKTPLNGGGITYEEVKKADIPDPGASASLELIQMDGKMSMPAGEPALLSALALPVFFAKEAAEPAGLQRPGTASGTEPGTEIMPLTEEKPGTEGTGEGSSEEGEGGEQQGGSPTVADVKITGSTEAYVGETVQLTAAVTMSDGSENQDVEWSGNAPGGSVKSDSAGSVTVTATAKADSSKSASHTVNFKEKEKPPAAVSGISLTASPSGARVGESVTITASVTMDDNSSYGGSVDWSASGGELTKNGSSASLKGTAAGTVKVTAKAGGKEASVDISFTEAEIKVSKVTMKDALTLDEGGSATLTASVEPGNATNKALEWKSDNTAAVTVDQSGNIKALKAGTANITATARDGSQKSASCKVTVNAATKYSVSLEDPGSMTSGETKQLKWSISPSDNVKSVELYVRNEDKSRAQVDNNGKLKALAWGTVQVTVRVKWHNGQEASASRDVKINADSNVRVSVDPKETTVKVGDRVKIKVKVETAGGKSVTWRNENKEIMKIVEETEEYCVVEALKPGKGAIVATSDEKHDEAADCQVTVLAKGDMGALLKDRAGNQLYCKDGDKYREATVADYYKYDVFYRQKDDGQYRYTGWQTLDGKRYFFDKNGNPVTGDQIIQGMKYTFNSDGSLQVNGNGVMGIDVSKHNGNIDWNAVKNAGVNFVIIRCGYRGSATGVLVEDPKFKANIQGATAAGLKVGIYFFSQAVNEVEAVEEASMAVSLMRNYKISYPVYMDVEAANGRADGMDANTRTKVINAFCQTIKNSGYTPGVYANKTWLNSKMNVGALGGYKIWLAQYAAAPTYNGRYEMWQYSSTGRISGISGNVDLNISYMGY